MIVVLPLQFYISVPIPLRWQTLHRGNPETGWPPHPLKLPGVVLSPGGLTQGEELTGSSRPAVHLASTGIACRSLLVRKALPRLSTPPRPCGAGGVHRIPPPAAGVQRPTCVTPHLALPNLDLCHLLLAHPRKQAQGPFLRIPPTSTYISRPPNSAPKPRDSDKPR